MVLCPPNHFVCYIIIRQQDWRRPVSLVVYRIVILVQNSWVNRLVYILRENISCTEELNWILGYPQRLFCLFASLFQRSFYESSSPHSVDFGSGSGNLSLALAAYLPGCHSTHLDEKPVAIALVKQRVGKRDLSTGSQGRWHVERPLRSGLSCATLDASLILYRPSA